MSDGGGGGGGLHRFWNDSMNFARCSCKYLLEFESMEAPLKGFIFDSRKF